MFAIFEDLWALAAGLRTGERPQFLQPEYLCKRFDLEPIVNVRVERPLPLPQGSSLQCRSSRLPIRDLYASSCQSLSCSQLSELLLLSQHDLFLLILKTHPSAPPFPFILRTRVVFLLKQFPFKLETEAEVIFTLLINFIIGETDAGDHRPGWMRGD